MEAPSGKPEGVFLIQFPARTAWGFVFEPSSKDWTILVLISGKRTFPNLGRMWARKWDSAARTVLSFKLTAIVERHSFANASSVIPDFFGKALVELTRSRYG
jgi:hypothetical protein